jgi:ATP-dependent DNA ligase
MLAKIAESLPEGEGYLFEPKWDGFRALVFRHNDQTYLQSRDLRPLNRYFPELEKAWHEALPKGCVLDGEIVVARQARASTSTPLQQRIHPAPSRIAGWPRKRRPASSPSTCWAPAASPPWPCRSPNAACDWNGCWPRRKRRCT